MGFGIATLGYGFLLTYEVGGGIFAGLLLAYGFFLASRTNERFLYASVSALFLIPHSVLLLLHAVKIADLNSLMYLRIISYSVFLVAWMSMAYCYLSAIKEIAKENKEPSLAAKADNRLYMTVLFLISAYSLVMFGTSFMKQFAMFLYVVQYIIIIINTFFLHKCFLLITTQSQYKKDKKRLAEEEEKLAAKRREKK